jgi:hypothetical protein
VLKKVVSAAIAGAIGSNPISAAGIASLAYALDIALLLQLAEPNSIKIAGKYPRLAALPFAPQNQRAMFVILNPATPVVALQFYLSNTFS